MLRILSAIFIFFSILHSFSQKQQQGSFLWELETNSSKVYLLGSIHMAKQNLFPLKKVIESAYEESEMIAVEVDAGSLGNEIEDIILKNAFFKDQRELKDLISQETFELLEKHLKSSGYCYKEISRMRPWYASLFFTKLSLEKIEAKSMFGIDAYFISRAHNENKQVLELESAASQISLISNLPDSEQEYLLKSSILQDDTLEKSFDELIAIWESGKTEEMEKFLAKEFKSAKELKTFNDDFIIKRNILMSRKIEEFIKDGKNIIVIIGAAHFTGEQGIIELLKKRGYAFVQK